MVGENNGPVALGYASHGHMKHAVGSLNVMLLQANTQWDTDRSAGGCTEPHTLTHSYTQKCTHTRSELSTVYEKTLSL